MEIQIFFIHFSYIQMIAEFNSYMSNIDIDFFKEVNIPLITNARLASAFINAFCTMTPDDLAIKSWEEYR